MLGHLEPVNIVEWFPLGNIIASGSRDHSIIIWDATSGCKFKILEGHTDNILALTWNKNGDSLISGSRD